MDCKILQGPCKQPNLADLLKRESERLLLLVEQYKEEQARKESAH
jgi:hypothetical protein